MTTSEPPGKRRTSRARLTRRLFPHGVPRLWCPTLPHITATGQFDEPRLRCHWRHLAPYVKIVDSPSMPRRKFLSAGGGLVAAIACGPFPAVPAVVASEPPPRRRSIGLQIGAVSFVDEGTDEVLDLLRERGGVDTIYLTTFTYGRGLAGRQIPGQPFPDHGKQESDEKTFHGGNYATPHPEFYRDTPLKQTRAPDHGDLDIVAAVLPAARKRGLRLLCSIEDVFRGDVPGVKEVAEVDLEGPQDRDALSLPSWRARLLDRPSPDSSPGFAEPNIRAVAKPRLKRGGCV